MSENFKVRLLSEEEAAKIERDGLVPVFRIRYRQRRFMGWVKRDDYLRGAVEIRFEGNEAGGSEAVIERAKSDS